MKGIDYYLIVIYINLKQGEYMYGAIMGDIVGSSFEFNNHRSPFFELFRKESYFTDDTVCTVAIADILNRYGDKITFDIVSDELRVWCCSFLNRGYGGMFLQWLTNGVNKPYCSYGNGSLMRISPVIKYAKKNNWDLDKTIEIACKLTEITHNHEESINAVKCYISILYKVWDDKVNYKKIIVNELNRYSYDIPQSIEKYRITISFDVTAKTSLLIACASLLETDSFEDVFYQVVSVGGDSDTYAAIAGPIAEIVYGIPNEYIENIKQYIKPFENKMIEVMNELYEN